jgi:hypothetical protein
MLIQAYGVTRVQVSEVRGKTDSREITGKSLGKARQNRGLPNNFSPLSP